ncbi:hypothetical protein IAT38_005280 [Cryptococcus sp. DSM 104549]
MMSSMSSFTGSSSGAPTSPYGESRRQFSSIATGTVSGPGDWNGNGLGYDPYSESPGGSTSTDGTGDISPITNASRFRDARRWEAASDDGSSVHSRYSDVSLSSGTTTIPETDPTQKSHAEPPSSALSGDSGPSFSDILEKIASEQRGRSPSASTTSLKSSDSTSSRTSLWSRAKSKFSSFFDSITNNSKYDSEEKESDQPYEFSMADMTPEDVLVGGSGNYPGMMSDDDTAAQTITGDGDYYPSTYTSNGDSSNLRRWPSWAESMMSSDDNTHQSSSGDEMYSLAVDPQEAKHMLDRRGR